MLTTTGMEASHGRHFIPHASMPTIFRGARRESSSAPSGVTTMFSSWTKGSAAPVPVQQEVPGKRRRIPGELGGETRQILDVGLGGHLQPVEPFAGHEPADALDSALELPAGEFTGFLASVVGCHGVHETGDLPALRAGAVGSG